jgi:hypothetical protein
MPLKLRLPDCPRCHTGLRVTAIAYLLHREKRVDFYLCKCGEEFRIPPEPKGERAKA